jgi:hypothetical protein
MSLISANFFLRHCGSMILTSNPTFCGWDRGFADGVLTVAMQMLLRDAGAAPASRGFTSAKTMASVRRTTQIEC